MRAVLRLPGGLPSAFRKTVGVVPIFSNTNRLIELLPRAVFRRHSYLDVDHYR